ncbi:MAG: cobalt ABC transporter ATP-binding protein [Actinobacteria bacterium 69-20]|nr:ABC transporter ATP-binding protein [Actinomycetota bacterium]OJV25822.1 MAG: cobalt ABC transporter ATP-binding protein [Actinobacteria bacterium 69-20]
MIRLDGVSYAYPDAVRPVLENVSLDIGRGAIAGILGASGAGKTTLAKIMAGFIPAVDGGELSGTVSVDGQGMGDLPLAEAVSRVGLVIQNPFNQISGARYTVREEIAFGLENFGVARPEMQGRVDEVAELLNLGPLLDRSPYELSGGQQQLVAIASMIVLRTPVLVMDEPTSQLDPAGTRMVFDVLSTLRGTGITVVIFEHKLELLHQHADALYVLADRSIVAAGDPTDILADARLAEWHIGSTRYTRAARAAQDRGLLAGLQHLPVSLEQAVAVFADDGGAR